VKTGNLSDKEFLHKSSIITGNKNKEIKTEFRLLKTEIE
jgi:hypothetical protein